MLSLLDEFISAHLNVLVEEIAPKDLLPVFSVQNLRMHESVTEHSLSYELEVPVVEEHIVVVKEQEGHY